MPTGRIRHLLVGAKSLWQQVARKWLRRPVHVPGKSSIWLPETSRSVSRRNEGRIVHITLLATVFVTLLIVAIFSGLAQNTAVFIAILIGLGALVFGWPVLKLAKKANPRGRKERTAHNRRD